MFDFSTPIDRTGTYCTQWDYVEDRFGKAGLLPFTISDMDIAAPQTILDAVTKRMTHPVFGYSRWNHDDFKQSITRWFSKRFNAEFTEEHVVYGPSVIYIISQLIRQWSKPQQGVIIHTPAYDAFEKMISGLERKVVTNQLLRDTSGYSIDWLKFEEQLSNPDNTILLLCSPHNPTGKVWSIEELAYMAELCEKHNVAVISDEIHMDICFKPHTPWQGFGMSDHWALVSSASKSFNIPALNGAYAFIANEEIRNQYLFNLKQVDGLSSPPILGILALMTAYDESEAWLDELVSYVRDNHDYVQQELARELPSIGYQIPDATYLAWIDLSSLAINMDELNNHLIEKYNVAIMQGKTYGEAGQHFVRLNLGCPRSKVEAGVGALVGAIKDLTKSD